MKVIIEKNITTNELVNHIAKKDVVLLTDRLKTWEIASITFDKLKNDYGTKQLRIRGGTRFNLRPLRWVTLSEYIDFLNKKENSLESLRSLSPYAAFNIISEFEKFTNFEQIIPKGAFHTPIVTWLGPKSSLTPLHYDNPGNTVFAQIIGVKKFILYSYDQKKYLYPSNVFDFTTIYSKVNIDNPDHVTYEKFKNAVKTEIIVKAGDILVFPNRMWHQVETLEDSLSFSCRYIPNKHFAWMSYLSWYFKSLLHLTGLYKKHSCLCHIEPISENDLLMMPPVGRILTKLTGYWHHGNDLCDLLGWDKVDNKTTELNL